MSDSPKDQDFNWVKAHSECSLAFEFALLQRDIERAADERSGQLPENSIGKLAVRSTSGTICIEREDGLDRLNPHVLFHLMPKHIRVRQNDRRDGKEFELTLTLNKAGKCRFQKDGKGRYKRWQVIRCALERLLFRDDAQP
ncbi:MAG: hypothetical protein OXJ37_03340 [Bryobacterales bacterium]|nr:hypothetical protein [Bryobacterales bacterium]MDE0623781.1 hypothetical protein [Bryobacterales bacterium]